MSGFRVDRLEAIIGMRLYAIANNENTLICYDIQNDQLLWDLPLQDKIQACFKINGVVNGKLRDVLVAHSHRRLHFVDLYAASVSKRLVYPYIDHVYMCGKYLLGYDVRDKTILLRGDQPYVANPIV